MGEIFTQNLQSLNEISTFNKEIIEDTRNELREGVIQKKIKESLENKNNSVTKKELKKLEDDITAFEMMLQQLESELNRAEEAQLNIEAKINKT